MNGNCFSVNQKAEVRVPIGSPEAEAGELEPVNNSASADQNNASMVS